MPGSKMFRESPEFYRPVDFVDIRKAKDVTPENGVRLYSTQRAVSWRLQVRGLLTLATGRESKDFVIAGASLDREALVALRDAIDEALKAPGRITIPGGNPRTGPRPFERRGCPAAKDRCERCGLFTCDACRSGCQCAGVVCKACDERARA